MKARFLSLPFALLSLTAVSAHAEDVSSSTQDFITKAAIGGQFEVESSRLALEKATNPEIKKFAQAMIDDHTKASEGLKAAVKSAGLTNVLMPTSLDEDHADDLADLKTKTGQDFDEEYVSDQSDAHEDAITVFSDYAKDGDNAVLKKFAADTLPVLEGHKTHIDALDKKVD